MLASCASVNKTQISTTQNHAAVSDFNKALETEYKNFAKLSLGDYMFLDYLHFKEKSARAQSGEEVAPEDLRKWKLPEEELRNLIWARGRLGSFMVNSAKEKYPNQLAHAQMLYDCWGTRAAKGMKPAKIEECRMDFILEMGSLENTLMPLQ